MTLSPPPPQITFEHQDLSRPRWRMCGAAALRMAYLSFGLDVPQQVIWPRIARSDGGGRRSARTHLLADDAQRRGLHAMVLQALRPRPLLEQSWMLPIRVILNQRMRANAREGHYTLLTGTDEQGILAHDPQLGPDHRLTWDTLIALWRPNRPDSEIAGQVLVAIWNESTAEHTCPECQMQVPTQTTCHACGTDIELHPHLLGCMALECQQRLWRRIFCPRCDALHTTLQGIANDENKRTLEPTGALS